MLKLINKTRSSTIPLREQSVSFVLSSHGKLFLLHARHVPNVAKRSI